MRLGRWCMLALALALGACGVDRIRHVDTDGLAADSGHPDSGHPDSGHPDAGTPDAGTRCTMSGVSPELAALTGGPYQNCQGGQIPRTDTQQNTGMWSGCCGTLVRVCAVTGYSMQNVVYCQYP